MATNKKKIFVTQTMSPGARALLNARDDIELVEFPNLISARDFEAMLKQHAPVHGVALGATRFGETELVEKARRYLADDAKRAEIAALGTQRCVQSDYSWARYMRDDWTKALAEFEKFKREKA